MNQRHVNHGLRKRCDCPRRQWPKCAHSWWFNYQPRGGKLYWISLDKYTKKHLDRRADAARVATQIRTSIDDGTFGQVAPRSEMTLAQLVNTYLERYVAAEHPSAVGECRSRLRVTCGTLLPCPTGDTAPFGDWRLADIVTDTIERYREARRAAGTGLGGSNRSLAQLRAMFNWAVRTGYIDHTPFKHNGEAIVRLSRETPRSRRLDGDRDEAAKLLNACGPHLRALVEAAIETGMRHGELMSLQWQQVVGMTVDTTKAAPVIKWAPRAEMVLNAAKTKTKRDRRIPISARLKAILEMRALDPNGQPQPADKYVFGNAIGQKILSVKRAWMTAVLKAHGIEANYNDKANLSPDSRAAFAQINLHFHDLRREAGSRWLEGGVPLHTVRDWLGHSTIAQTSTYLAGTAQTQHDAMAAYEARRALVLLCTTDDAERHFSTPGSTGEAEETPNKTGLDRQLPIM